MIDLLKQFLFLICIAHCTVATPRELALRITPDHGNLMGGDVVMMQGPSFQTNQHVQIKVGEFKVNCLGLNYTHAVCRTPRLYDRGTVAVTYAHQEQLYTANFFIENPLSSEPSAWIENPEAYNEVSPESISIRFDPSKLGHQSSETIYLLLELWGYREMQGKVQYQLMYSTTESYTPGSQYEPRLSITANQITKNGFTSTFKMGIFKVAVRNDNLFRPHLWSHPVPLGWVFETYWTDFYKPLDWAHVMCQQWAFEDATKGDVFAELPCCPTTIETMQQMGSSFVHDDDFETRYMNTTAYSFPRLLACYISKQPTSSGAGQQCCYNKLGQLTLEGDVNRKTSYPCRAHPFGFYPYEVILSVPGLSHWYNDFIPYLTCCKWSTNPDTCDIYKAQRPQAKCETTTPH